MKSMIVANWKMNPPTFREARALLEATKKAADMGKNVSIIVAPPAIYLRELRASYRGKKLSFAAQNAHFEKSGAFTGEISLMQLKDAGISAVIIGHAERRAMGETNDDTRKKVAAALSAGIAPVLCVGEVKRGSEGEHWSFIKEELRAGFADVPAGKIPRVVVAYEPVWAIGAATPMTPRDMHEVAIFIRKAIVELYGDKGMSVKILYGGSIDEGSAPAMLQQGDVDGLLAGRASAEGAKMLALVRAMQNA